MPYQILSRRYRPQRFDEVSGQTHVRKVLTGALRNRRVGQAFLFVGPRGVGKTTMARIFARALNCAENASRWEDDGKVTKDDIPLEPCGKCPSCVGVAASSDLDVVEMDAASNNHVEDVRTLRERVGYAAARSPFRIWIVDEVHMLSRAAFDAFLKTLEEPPPWVKFIFCTTEVHKLPATFRSRCSLLEFRAIDPPTLAERLRMLASKESVELEDGLPQRIARAALGGMRDAESMLEQLLAVHEEGVITRADFDMLCGRLSETGMHDLMRSVDEGNATGAIATLDDAIADGAKPGVILDQWLDAWRMEMVGETSEGDGESSRSTRDAPSASDQMRACQAIEVLLTKRAHLRAGADGSLLLHVAAVELARLPNARDLDALLASIDPDASPSAPLSPADSNPDRTPPPSAGASQQGSTTRPRARATTQPRLQEQASSEDNGSARRTATASARGDSTHESAAQAAHQAPPNGAAITHAASVALLDEKRDVSGEQSPVRDAKTDPGTPTKPTKPQTSNAPSTKTNTAKSTKSRPGKTVRPESSPPAAPVPTEGGSLRAAHVQAKWSEILEAAQRRDPVLAQLLDEVSVRDVKGQTIRISIPTQAIQARRAFVRPEYQMAFGQVLREVCGQFLRPVVLASGPTQLDGFLADEAAAHPDIDRVVQRTAGQVLWVRRSDSGSGFAPSSGSA